MAFSKVAFLMSKDMPSSKICGKEELPKSMKYCLKLPFLELDSLSNPNSRCFL